MCIRDRNMEVMYGSPYRYFINVILTILSRPTTIRYLKMIKWRIRYEWNERVGRASHSTSLVVALSVQFPRDVALCQTSATVTLDNQVLIQVLVRHFTLQSITFPKECNQLLRTYGNFRLAQFLKTGLIHCGRKMVAPHLVSVWKWIIFSHLTRRTSEENTN